MLRRRFGLMLRFPLGSGHAVNDFACCVLRQLSVRLHHPIGETISAKAGKAHQVDILRVVPVLQMCDEAAKCGGRDGV